MYNAVCVLLLMVLSTGCKQHADLSTDDYYLVGCNVKSDSRSFPANELSSYVRQRPQSKIFSVIPNIFARKTIYDSLLTDRTCYDMQNAMVNMGYLHADVDIEKQIRGRKLSLTYCLHPGESFFINNFITEIEDTLVRQQILSNPSLFSSVERGKTFSVSTLSDIRKNITTLLNENGYFRFNKDYITFDVDTLRGQHDVNITLFVRGQHSLYNIRNIHYQNVDKPSLGIRKRVLDNNTALVPGSLYSVRNLQRTYNNLARLQAVRYSNIRLTELPDTNALDCDILFSTSRPQTVSFMPEGTNTAGDFGAAATFTYENRNLFHGSELFSLQARFAYEAITGLEGYNDQNYFEYGVESKLTFPRLLAPLLSQRTKRNSTALTEFSLAFNVQNRPEFHRNNFGLSWRYRWNDSKKNSYRFDLLDLNYIFMPWISPTFKADYLDDAGSRNAILRYNYEDLFIMRLGFNFALTRRNYALKTKVETAGNLLDLVARTAGFAKNADSQYKIFNIAFAQYAKADVDYTHTFSFDHRNQLVVHANIGVAYPYGNSTILPFEKRYFSGGANSVRGWTVRSLGPGSFRGKDGRIDFINQTGDVKLDLSVEHRTQLFWKFSGALFVDAGNIWTLRSYTEQTGGQFAFSTFYKELAVAYGLGLRVNLGYFVLRLDAGMKAVNPAFQAHKQHYPITNPSISRDGALHFAVGLPF